MIDRKTRIAFVAILLGAFVGCDTNPGAPTVPANAPAGNPTAVQAPPAAPKVPGKANQGAAPNLP